VRQYPVAREHFGRGNTIRTSIAALQPVVSGGSNGFRPGQILGFGIAAAAKRIASAAVV
jgi:hypothetical protein